MNSVVENMTTASHSSALQRPSTTAMEGRAQRDQISASRSSALQKTSVLVIGWGNDLLGDDAVGRLVAQAIAARHWPGVEALDVHQLTPELSVQLSQAGCVIFVDACMDSGRETVHLRKLSRDDGADSLTSGHVASPEGLLNMADALYDARPEAWLIAVPARTFEPGQPLSEIARAGYDAAVSAIQQHVQTGMNTHFMHNHLKGSLYDADR